MTRLKVARLALLLDQPDELRGQVGGYRQDRSVRCMESTPSRGWLEGVELRIWGEDRSYDMSCRHRPSTAGPKTFDCWLGSPDAAQGPRGAHADNGATVVPADTEDAALGVGESADPLQVLVTPGRFPLDVVPQPGPVSENPRRCLGNRLAAGNPWQP